MPPRTTMAYAGGNDEVKSRRGASKIARVSGTEMARHVLREGLEAAVKARFIQENTVCLLLVTPKCYQHNPGEVDMAGHAILASEVASVYLFRRRLSWFLVSGLAMLAPAAHAGTLFSLDQDGCSGGCGTSPFATVTLTQVNADTVLVTEVLLNGSEYVRTGAGDALEFNLLGDPAITISDLTSGFSVGPSPDKAASFGWFDYSVTCSGCGPGASSPLFGPLSFEVQLTGGGALSTDNFVENDGGYSFASDLHGSNGNGGNVAAQDGTDSPVLEPSPAFLLLTGGAILFLKKRLLA